MKDKKAIIIVVLLILLFLSGCGSTGSTEESRFKTIESQFFYDVCVDTQTGVEYLMTGYGNVTVLVDKDGNPLLANGWGDYEAD